MKRILFPIAMFAIACSLVCCSGKGDRLTHKSARHAAERYFTMLIDGHYEEYVDGLAGSDSMPEDLRSEMIDLVAQFAVNHKVRREMLSVVAADDSLRDSTAFVLLDVFYGDSTSERVGMPLVFSDGRWLMQ